MDILNVLEKNKEAVKELVKAASPQELYEVLKKYGYEESYDQFIENITKARAVHEKRQAGLLTEDDMDNLLENPSSDQTLGTFFFFLIPFGV